MQRPLSRRAPRPVGVRWATKGIAFVAAAAVLTAACSSSDNDEAVKQQGEVVPAARQELVVGYAGDPWIDASEPDKKRVANYPLNSDVCETLVQLTPDFQVASSLASEWKHVGGNTFRFTLKEGPTFSDGRPVTANDVKYSLDYTAAAPATSGFAFLGPESTKVIDERTVEVTPTKPNLRLIEQITHPTYSIMAAGSDPLNDPNSIVCSGPFKVVEYVAGERLVVERNENYWGTPAKLDMLTFRFIPDDTTRTLALQNGEVDLVTEVPHGILSTLEGVANLKTSKAPVGQVLIMYVARRTASDQPRILADPVLRRAAAHAFDQSEFVEGVLDGNAERVKTVAPAAVLGEFAGMVKGVSYDPKEAARLLDGAGWKPGPDGVRVKDGKRLDVSIVFDPARVELTAVEFIQAKLRAAGFGANLERLDPGAYRERLDSGNYDLDVSAPNQNDANPAFLLSLRWYSKASGKNAKIISPGPDTKYEQLIDQTQQATDKRELQRLSAEAMHELVDVEVGGIPMAGVYQVMVMKDTVQGLEMHPSNTNQRWHDVFISQ
jgi:peptide/nickel transport system substrate-binding protein